MPVAQWAPWVAVFMGGCLSGAALLSLGMNRAPVATVVPTEKAARPVDLAQPVEAPHQSQLAPSVVQASDEVVAPPQPETIVEPEAETSAPSAADILVELENAYQKQLAHTEVEVEAEAAGAPDAERTAEAPAEPIAPPVGVARSSGAKDELPGASTNEERVAALSVDEADAPALLDPTVVRADAEAHHQGDSQQTQIQQIAVLYQPVVVVPGAAQAPPSPATPPKRSIGLDPWAPIQMSPRHNPWAVTPPSGGAWGNIGPQGSVWGVSFAHRP